MVCGGLWRFVEDSMVGVGSWVEVLDWMVSREPFNIGSLRAVITVLYQAKGKLRLKQIYVEYRVM